MISLDPSWLLALPLLFVMGWIAARIDLRQQRAVRRAGLDRLPDVIAALVAKDTQAASASLLNAIRDNPDDLRLQQALGTLLRDRGEPDRAIEVRLSLLARPGLPDHFRQDALLELARDYLAAGIFDRADQSLGLLRESAHEEAALRLRLHLMQRQRRWQEAHQVALELAQKANAPDLLKIERFHFLMEQGLTDEAAALWPGHPRLSTEDESEANTNKLYVCRHCGFQARRHGWQCAGCGQWDTLVPVA